VLITAIYIKPTNWLLYFLFAVLLFCAPQWLFAQGPTASFTQDKTQGCLPLIVNFTETATGNISSYFWDFGNGNTSTLQNPGAVYAKSGVFNVKLIVTDNTGKKDSILRTTAVTVFDNPKAAYVGVPTGICEGQKVKFTDKSTVVTNPIKTWSWNFGDGKQSTQQSPENTYNASGTYAVSLIVEDTKGCKDILNQTNYISVGKPPTVDFAADITSGCITPLKVTFKDKSQTSGSTSVSYHWDFGDGDTSNQQNPVHSYKSSATFNVTLTVTDGLGCTVTKTTNNFISIGKTVANFDANIKTGCTPLAINFQNNSANVPSNARVVWFFGNGDSVVGYQPTYTYTQPGDYDVTLKITSPDACNDAITKAKFIKVIQSPVVDFRSNDSVSCKPPSKFFFTANTVNAQKWEWEFGDSSVSTQQNPTKIYMSPGVYYVSLKVTFNNGCVVQQTKTDYVKINTQRAFFLVPDSGGCIPTTINFINRSTSYFGIKSYSWDFDNGQTSTKKDPDPVVYTTAGTFQPKLTIVDSAGCTDTYVYKSIKLGEKVKPDFVADKRAGCKQDMKEVTFTNLTDVTKTHVDTFVWIFGAGAKVKSQNPFVVDYSGEHFLTNPDSVDVTLISVSGRCYDTLVKKKYIVLYPPDVLLEYNIDNCKLDTILFTNSSKGADVFRWWMDTVEVLNTKEFKKFLPPGEHTLNAVGVNNGNGCKDSTAQKIKILRPLVAEIGVNTKGLCGGDSITFYAKGSNDGERYPMNYEWRVNGSFIKSGIHETSFSYIFSDTSVFNVVLTITDAFGCIKRDTAYDVGRNQKLPVTLTVTPDKGCFPLTAQLIYQSLPGLITEAKWVIDGTTINATKDTLPYVFNTPIYAMNTTGIDVVFKAKDTTGCTLSKTQKVFISKVTADFFANPTQNCASTDLSFFNTSNGLMPYGGLSFNWLMNDTLAFNSSSNNYTFNKSGTHKLSLSIKDNVLGCADSTEKTVEVKVKKIKADFNVDKTSISCPPLVSRFTDNSIYENTYITEVLWRFGDGSASTEFAPIKNYFYPGSYDIVYKITDARGCVDSVRTPGKIFVGGPYGTPISDKEKGCAPLTVNFEAINPSVGNIRWDFGDGVLVTGKKVQNTYTRPATYQPYMVLADSVGCTVFYPTKPIEVYPSPEPAFADSGVCWYNPFTFINQTDTTTPTTFVWRFDSGDTLTGYNAQYQFGNHGQHSVTLEATSINGCTAQLQKPVEGINLKADFSLNNTAACLDAAIKGFDKSQSDAGIKQWLWWLGNGTTATGPAPALVYTVPGNYQISLIIEDNKGCFDSALNSQTLTVYDTTPPPTPWAYRVTVEEDNSIRFDFSEYARVDFGKYIIYKAPAGKPLQVYKEINTKTDTIYIDKAVNPDTSSYTYKVVNVSFCERYSNERDSRAHTTVLLKGTPDTNATHLFWSPYDGWDVVKTYHIYRKEPSQAAFVKIGAVPGSQTNYTDSSAYCNITYLYYVIAEQEAAANVQFSRSNTISLTPFHKATVQPGTIIRVTVEDDKNILIEFAPPQVITAPITSYSIEKSVNGGFDYTGIFTTPTCCPSFLDKKVDVHKQSYHYRVLTTDYCADISAPSNLGKSILLNSYINTDDNVRVSWSAYQRWEDGVKRYELEVKNAGGEYVSAGVNNLTAIDTVYIDETGNYNYLPKVCYRVIGISNNDVVSYSNTDCVTGRSSLFVPNAFTPNKDGFNNNFVVVGAYIQTYQIQIFNRYGEKLYTSYSLEDTWDGTYKGETAQQDVYIYVITAEGMDHKRYNLSGNITLLR
jgi:gliding motility-associated-like protein